MKIERELYYQQTPFERYSTTMNDQARALLIGEGLVIIGEWGGSGIGTGINALVADQAFLVETEAAESFIVSAATKLEILIGRDIRVLDLAALEV